MTPVYIVAGLWTLGAIILAVLIHRAPLGYEDSAGWHPGEPKPHAAEVTPPADTGTPA